MSDNVAYPIIASPFDAEQNEVGGSSAWRAFAKVTLGEEGKLNVVSGNEKLKEGFIIVDKNLKILVESKGDDFEVFEVYSFDGAQTLTPMNKEDILKFASI